MFIDALLKVASAQAMGAAAVSASSIDLGLTSPIRQVGSGQPLGFGIQITTAATVAATLVEIISATDAALTAGIVSEASITIPLATALVNTLWFVPLPQGKPTGGRFIGVRTTTAGGTISISAWLTTFDLFSLISPTAYPKNYVV